MSGSKVNTKSKGKDDRGKGNKCLGSTQEEVEDNNDYSILRRPVRTSITGFRQARKIFDLATEELKTLISDECDLLYECKVCRNIFRSLANFISHKRVYCRDKFSTSLHGHFVKPFSTTKEINKIRHTEEGYQESLKENGVEMMGIDDNDERIPLTKDLTTIVEKLAKNKGATQNNEYVEVALQKIASSNVAVFQSIQNGDMIKNDSMRSQVNEIDMMTSRDVAVLQSDGNFKVQSLNEGDNVIQISDDEDCDTDELKCNLCDMQFSTQKTLKFHMKYKHVESRLVYPCPDCLEIFSTSWSVYRHLFKVHRKTAAQIRRMRESIQSKAFRMNNPPASYEKRKNTIKSANAMQKITEEERLDQENQAWMDNMECDSEVPRCGGCGRTFERRAALAAHTHTCQPRSRALARRTETKRIEIQIRKDYNKGPAPTLALTSKPEARVPDTKTIKETQEPVKVESINQNVEPDIKPKEEKEEPEIEQNIPETDPKTVDDNSMDSVSRQSDDLTSNEADSPEKDTDTPMKTANVSSITRLPFAQHAEKSNLMALRQRIIGDIELEKLLCKKCDTQHDHIQKLYDHVATHYKWMRYACKLCNFKHYYFEKLPEHVKVVHKLKGDKDFYFSTVKALDGAEASELSEPMEQVTEAPDTSPNSRRPSRCSSDSSRLSDDSSSSSTRVEPNNRKRKVQQSKGYGKKRRESSIKVNKEKDDDVDENDLNVKTSEENSSDIDEVYDKTDKKLTVEDNSSVASRRPVRRRIKPKNEDFEYDLSNLLKMEAQGYTNVKASQSRKKTQQDNLINYEILNKECCGALVSLSRKSVELAKAHMKTSSLPSFSAPKDIKSNIFVRPMLPKGIYRGDKVSPRKDTVEERKDNVANISNLLKEIPSASNSKIDENINKTTNANNNIETVTNEETETKSKSFNIPPVLPIKFRRQSMEVIKNPIINKNIKDFTKAGMKTKILVIKPINRKDGSQPVNTPLKFQTIKLKEVNKTATGEDMSSDQVVVVKVPQVDCAISRPPDSTVTTAEQLPIENSESSTDNKESDTSPSEIKEISNVKSNIDIKKSSSPIPVIDSNDKEIEKNVEKTEIKPVSENVSDVEIKEETKESNRVISNDCSSNTVSDSKETSLLTDGNPASP